MLGAVITQRAVSYTHLDVYKRQNSYHPYKRSGWNRENVYNSLGFNHFYSMEYYKNPEFIRNFISDKTDIEQITKDYEKARRCV